MHERFEKSQDIYPVFSAKNGLDVNHDKYGNILYAGGHVLGFAGARWTDNSGSSCFGY